MFIGPSFRLVKLRPPSPFNHRKNKTKSIARPHLIMLFISALLWDFSFSFGVFRKDVVTEVEREVGGEGGTHILNNIKVQGSVFFPFWVLVCIRLEGHPSGLTMQGEVCRVSLMLRGPGGRIVGKQLGQTGAQTNYPPHVGVSCELWNFRFVPESRHVSFSSWYRHRITLAKRNIPFFFLVFCLAWRMKLSLFYLVVLLIIKFCR